MLLALPVPTPMHRQWSFAKLLILIKYHESSAPPPAEENIHWAHASSWASHCFTVSLTHSLTLSSHVHAGEDPPAEQVDVEFVYAIHGTDYSG